ncbi:mitochondrial import inner membrane translocase subunit Tim8 A-like [Diadema setosum]|uniref:mitochondrial import inner membrane translocase subunit Tim8 A-like n=1 Tax=Diadema antillarum TaxID=105358 RepID=UPI003A896B68
MAFNAQQGAGGVDPELARFINLESQRQKFSQLVYALTDTCWEKCVADLRLGNRLENKTETCLVNCVERFIDTTNFIVNRLESVQSSPGSKLGAL